MSTDLEQALRRALDATDGVVRAPERDLVAGAVRGHRRRRVVRTGAAGAAVLAVAIAATALVAGDAGDADQRTGTAGPTRASHLILDPAAARPIEEVWPQAIHTLPARLPDGQDYNVIEEIAAGTFVVQAKADFERYRSVYRYEPATGTLVELIHAPPTTGISPVGRAMVLDGRYVAAQVHQADHPSSRVDVVSVVDGARVARVDLSFRSVIDMMAWADDRLLWTTGGNGIFSATDPLSVLPGSSGFHLTGQGAWAVANESATVTWWNVATGERHEEPAGSFPLPCYGTTCITSTGRANKFQIIGVDGPGGTASLEHLNRSMLSWGDHFVVLTLQPHAVCLLWDLRTNTYARYPMPTDSTDTAGSDTDILVLVADDKHKVVVNLAAI